ncbi:hypothetical protein B0H19DRAFT_107510 [Mycena capillaripes]|nr:hypothetical protein B0H19DRAFT_107510 [Mycena capillaripes]
MKKRRVAFLGDDAMDKYVAQNGWTPNCVSLTPTTITHFAALPVLAHTLAPLAGHPRRPSPPFSSVVRVQV